jgi:1,4-alpha-glucan branching enzyme
VGDKTISMWLFDSDIYHGMSKFGQRSIRVDRGMALHKMIRLLTQSLGGESYLNFMGNEFGHPEWIDFPSEGNNYSYHYCRRQWNLHDDSNLMFESLGKFDAEMNKWEEVCHTMTSEHQFISLQHEDDKVIVFEKGNLLFAFNFHPTKSFENYAIGTGWASDHIILFDSDQTEFSGLGRLDSGRNRRFVPNQSSWHKRPNSIKIYLPSRTCIVFIAEENVSQDFKDQGVVLPQIHRATP